MFEIKHQSRKHATLFIGLGLLCILLGLILAIPPTNLTILAIFFLLFFISVFYLSSFLLNHRRRAFFTATVVIIYFLLRLLKLRHWSYLLVIALLCCGIELYVHRRQNPPPFIRKVKRV